MPSRMPVIDSRMVGNLADFFPSTCSIQEKVTTDDATGHSIPAWSDVAGLTDLPCRIAPKGGDEFRKPDMTYGVNVRTIEIAGYYDTITIVMRVLWGFIEYDILLIEHDGQSEMTRLTVELVA